MEDGKDCRAIAGTRWFGQERASADGEGSVQAAGAEAVHPTRGFGRKLKAQRYAVSNRIEI